MEGFRILKPSEIIFDPITRIGEEWMLITAGNENKLNAMTASWGGTGYLWNKPVIFIFIRPQRYTFEFVEHHDIFTCSFFKAEYKKLLNYFGTVSGRDEDKIAVSGLTPLVTPNGGFTYKEAHTSIECRKIYSQDLSLPGFADKSLLRHYPKNDFHKMYAGEILSFIEGINT